MEEDGESRYKITDIIGEGIIPKFNNILDRNQLKFMKVLAVETLYSETKQSTEDDSRTGQCSGQ